MKNRLVKILSVVLSLSLLLPVFGLAGCTDKTPKARELNAIELQLVGTWKSKQNTLYYFKSDGTWEANGHVSEFRQEGEAVMTVGDKYGHFYWIYDHPDAKNPNFAYFDDEPDKLYSFSDGQYLNSWLERVTD